MQRLSLSTAILATLAYSDVFQAPLTLSEITQRLIGYHASEKEVAQAIQKIPQVKRHKKEYFLENSPRVIEISQERFLWSIKKWDEVKQIQSLLQKLPTICSVYVTGSLAVNNLDSLRDDIDLMVVCRPRSLWWTRLIVITKASIRNKYRTHASKGEDKWCFNLWVEEPRLTIPEKDRNLYVAYEIVQARQIVGERNTLLDANQWINEYINYPTSSHKVRNYSVLTNPEPQTRFAQILLNEFSYCIQRLYMWPHKTVENVQKTTAFFHPRRTRMLISKKWLAKLDELDISQKEMSVLKEYIGEK